MATKVEPRNIEPRPRRPDVVSSPSAELDETRSRNNAVAIKFNVDSEFLAASQKKSSQRTGKRSLGTDPEFVDSQGFPEGCSSSDAVRPRLSGECLALGLRLDGRTLPGSSSSDSGSDDHTDTTGNNWIAANFKDKVFDKTAAEESTKVFLRSSVLFYTTPFFALLATVSITALIFLVPFVIDPAWSTLMADFDPNGTQCTTSLGEYLEGSFLRNDLLAATTISLFSFQDDQSANGHPARKAAQAQSSNAGTSKFNT